ncbi:hypothetical protein NP233_g11297 [Leucocoprinus birnbaumii]|uniref:pyranose dehydrogenase (acceptor) n=1 Tax=Leucocoprinus birnbaumii TaxID=56174 RepID=A0AAD5VJ68_9AGAR|nr:hypothetical protein NP233_g11297 [Leucocoprinus birnbaumii]
MMMRALSFGSIILWALVVPTRGAVYTCFEDVPQSSHFDFVIVGGGTAGNTLANRLTENPHFHVLVLEAGPSNEGVIDSMVPFFANRASPFTPWDWNYTAIPQETLNNRSIVYPRGHILGGSSSVILGSDYMVYTRGSSEDWDRYASISQNQGWSWHSIQEYIRKNEKWTEPADHHNTTGQFNPKLHTTRGVNSVSLPGFLWKNTDERIIQTTKDFADEFPFNEDMNSGSHLGIGWTQNTIDGSTGRRSSSATSYLGPHFISRKNLNVLVNARVTRLVKTGTSRDGKPEILGVEFLDANNPEKKFTVQAHKELILSAGSINTPQILQLSGIGDRHLLSSMKIPVLVDNPSVGRNLSDHPLVPNIWRANSNNTFQAAQRNATLASEQFQEWNTTGKGPLTNEFTNQLGWLRIPASVTDFWGNIEDPAAGNNTAHYEFMLCNGVIPGASALPSSDNYFSIFTAVVSPASRGSVALNTSSPLDAPLIDPGFYKEEIDLKVMKFAIRSAQRFLTGPAWSEYIISAVDGQGNTTMTGDDSQLEQYIKENTATVFHPTGTSSMSPVNAGWGVVDPDLKVKGVVGVRIVDLSVLPIVPAAHPQAAAYVVGERAGDLIMKSMGSN